MKKLIFNIRNFFSKLSGFDLKTNLPAVESKPLVKQDFESICLQKINNLKFRVVRVEYPENNLVIFRAQVWIKRRYNALYTGEHNNNRWWGLCVGSGGYLYPAIFANSGYPYPTEEDALQAIEKYKAQELKELLDAPMREQERKETAKLLAQLQKERYEEALKNAPKITFKEVK